MSQRGIALTRNYNIQADKTLVYTETIYCFHQLFYVHETHSAKWTCDGAPPPHPHTKFCCSIESDQR